MKTPQTPIKSYVLIDNPMVLDNFERPYTLRVRDLPEEFQPREKLLKGGATTVSVAELLAIILNTGTTKEDVMGMSSRILKEYGSYGIAHETNPTKLHKQFDIPLVKACQIVACFELGRRFFDKKTIGIKTIRTAKQAFEYLKDMRDLEREQLRGIYLNSRHRIVHDETISIGTLTASIVDPREIFKPAIEHGAVGIILAHNHPSGSPKATTSDIEATRRIVEAGEILGISILDHLIITKKSYSSVPSERSDHEASQ